MHHMHSIRSNVAAGPYANKNSPCKGLDLAQCYVEFQGSVSNTSNLSGVPTRRRQPSPPELTASWIISTPTAN